MTKTTKQLTKTALAALEQLRAMQPFTITPARTLIARDSRRPIAIPAIIETGINTTVLRSLRDAGAITCTTIWARGHVTPDLRIVEGR